MTIKLVGTPAEESGGGTVLLLQRGVFNVVAMAMMVHPAPEYGGAAPNVVAANTSARYHSPAFESLHQMEARVQACFEAGVLATGCAHEATQVGPVYIQRVPDPWLAAACCGAITGLGRADRAVDDGALALALTGLAAATDDAQRDQLIGTQSRRVPAAGGDS